MNKDQLASVVASEVGLSQSDAKAAVDAVSQDTGLLDRVEIQQLEKQSRLLQRMHQLLKLQKD